MATPILEKIQLLLNKAESTNFPAEAEAFFEAAQKLMVRHAIDQSMLPGSDQKKEKVIQREVKVAARDEIYKAKQILLSYIARANRCRIYTSKSRGIIVIVGFESDTEFVEMLYFSVLMQYAIARTRGWKQYEGSLSRHLWVTSFASSYAMRIGERLQENAVVAVREAEATTTGMELVLVNREDEVKDYMGNIPGLRKGRTININRHNASGREAANSADLTGGRNNLNGRSATAIGR